LDEQSATNDRYALLWGGDAGQATGGGLFGEWCSGLPGCVAISPGQVEGAVDGSFSDVGKPEVVASGIGPKQRERFVHVDVGTFGDHAFGLLDHDAAR